MKRKKRKKKNKNTSIIPFVVGIIIVTIVFAVVLRAASSCSNVSSVKTTIIPPQKNDSTHTNTGITNEDSVTEFRECPEQELITKNDIRTITLMEQAVIPSDISNYYIEHTGYSISYNLVTHCPNWVAWELTSNEIDGPYPRTNDYRKDEKLPRSHYVETTAFSSVSYDRGHMCPAGDMKWSAEAMSASFYMTNMCPQDNSLNNGAWKRLEEACRRWAEHEGKVYICCGPIFKGNEEVIDNNPQITIPSAFFKVVLSTKEGHEKAIGFYFENNDKKQTVGNAVRTVDEIEEITGFDFFPQLDDEIENKVESYAKLSKWN